MDSNRAMVNKQRPTLSPKKKWALFLIALEIPGPEGTEPCHDPL